MEYAEKLAEGTTYTSTFGLAPIYVGIHNKKGYIIAIDHRDGKTWIPIAIINGDPIRLAGAMYALQSQGTIQDWFLSDVGIDHFVNQKKEIAKENKRSKYTSYSQWDDREGQWD